MDSCIELHELWTSFLTNIHWTNHLNLTLSYFLKLLWIVLHRGLRFSGYNCSQLRQMLKYRYCTSRIVSSLASGRCCCQVLVSRTVARWRCAATSACGVSRLIGETTSFRASSDDTSRHLMHCTDSVHTVHPSTHTHTHTLSVIAPRTTDFLTISQAGVFEQLYSPWR